MPRPVRVFPLPRGLGDTRWSQPKVSAAALTAAIERARLNPLSSVVPARSFKRNSTGSILAAAATSSMKDSAANVDWGPLGSRRLPVRNGVSQARGRLTTSPTIRRLGMAYISDGMEELPAEGLARLEPINCAIS